MSQNLPPKLGRWLLRRIYDDYLFDEISGDLEEIYNDRLLTRKKWVASACYMKDVILSLRNIGLKKKRPAQQTNLAMIKNLIIISFRSLKKRASYSILNIAGLATSMAFAFLLWLYVQDQNSYDRHFPLANQIYRVNLEADMNGKKDVYSNVPQPVAAALKSSYPQIKETVHIALTDHLGTLEYEGKKIQSSKFVIADPTVLKLFEREFIEGHASSALSEPASIVISESMTRDLLGGKDVLGKTVYFIEFEKNLKVTGIIKDDQRRSHFPMEAIVSWNTFPEYNSDQWYGAHVYTYVLLNEANNIALLEQQMPAFFNRFMKKTFDEFNGKGQILFQPLTDIHLSDELVWEPNPHGSRINVLALSFVALFLVAFGVINYVNLATARAAERASEVGIRKMLGSSRRFLWAQFLGESMILSISSGLLALVASWAILPYFNQLTNLDLNTFHFFSPYNIGAVILLSVSIGLLSGIFPAFYLSSLQALKVLKGKFKSSHGGELLRRALVTSQYFIAALLISSILLVYKQIVFIKNKDIGFNKENLVNIKVSSDSTVNNHIDVYRDAIKTSPRVLSASLTHVELHKEINSFSPTLQNEDGTTFQMGSDIMYADADFIPTIGAAIVVGRNFDKKIAGEAENSILINEAAVKAFGWEKNPLGGKFAGYTPREPSKRNVIGVVKDFHLGVSYQRVHPTIIFLSQGGESNLYARISGHEMKPTLEMMQATWKEHFPNHNFEYSFVDQSLNSLYDREENFLTLLTGLCAIILIIASLGIIGLISYTTQLKKKEIAIRKVLGSSFRNIITGLSRKFVFLLIIANVLAVPATYYLIGFWMENFAYRIELSPGPFIAPLLVCGLFTGLSIFYHTVQAAMANPVEALKYE